MNNRPHTPQQHFGASPSFDVSYRAGALTQQRQSVLHAPLLWLAALPAALLLAACPVQAAAPASDQVWRSMQSPYPSFTQFDNSSTAWHSFYANATSTYGFSAYTVNLTALPLGSFQGSSGGLTAPVYNSNVTVNISSNAEQYARLQAGNDPNAFTDTGSGFRYLHVAAYGQASQDATLLTLNFNRPVQGIAFLGANISNYAGFPPGNWPSQSIQLDNRPTIDVLGVDPGTVVSQSRLSFGVLAAQSFSTVRLLLPAGSANDNAALGALLVAFDPNAVAPPPVPEPGTWALMAAGLAVLLRVSRQSAAR